MLPGAIGQSLPVRARGGSAPWARRGLMCLLGSNCSREREREKDAVMKTFHHRLGPLTCFARLKQLAGSARAASQQPRGAGGRAGPGSGYRHLSQRRHPSRGEGDRRQPQPGARWHQLQGERVLTPRSGTKCGRVLQAGGCRPGLCKFWRCWRSPWARSSSSLAGSYFYPLSGKALAGARDGGCYN